MSLLTTAEEPVSKSSTLCSINDCTIPFDVHCFHCHSYMCSHHYFEHKQQQQQELIIELDDPMDDLLELASSKWFCITNGRTSICKTRRSFSNPFVSSTYLLKKMKQQAARQRKRIKSNVITKRTYISRMRSKKRHQKLASTTAIDVCGFLLKTKLRNNKFCNRKLPCPYHTVE